MSNLSKFEGHEIDYSYSIPADVIQYIKHVMSDRLAEPNAKQQIVDILEHTTIHHIKGSGNLAIDVALDKPLLITEENRNDFLYLLNAGYRNDTGPVKVLLKKVSVSPTQSNTGVVELLKSAQSLHDFLDDVIDITGEHYTIDLVAMVIKRKEPLMKRLVLSEAKRRVVDGNVLAVRVFTLPDYTGKVELMTIITKPSVE